MKKTYKKRVGILVGFILAVFSLFSLKLVQYQIIEGEENLQKSNTSIRFKQNITAARGDIVDKFGVPIASSQSVFNVVLNKAYLPNELLNQRILQALEILEDNSEKINDILPLETDYPYNFIQSKEVEISRMRESFDLNVYATEEDVIHHMVERYSLQEISEQYWRILGGIRYTMERDGYSLSYPYVLAKDVSLDTVAIISENSREITGVEIDETSKRYYANGTLLPHILGTIGPIYAEEYEELKNQGYKINDILGKDGLEKSYESYLKGVDGTVEIEKNMYGEIVDKSIVEPPVSGNDLKLTIDSALQKKLNDILVYQMDVLHQKETLWGKEASAICAVILDVKTGSVLAVSNYPSYDLNLYSSNYETYANDENNPLFNRALQGLYRPGSVFKSSVATAALREGVITEDTIINCVGTYMHYAPTYTPSCALNTRHGPINVKTALKVSCNYFFYETGRRLGIEKMNEIAHQLGLGVKTGLEVPEKTGLLTSPEARKANNASWEAGDVIQAAIGQSDTVVTAVQLATYALTLANNGVRVNTHLVDSILDSQENIVYKTPITVLATIEDKNDAHRIVQEGMLMASEQGAASRYLLNLPYKIASKTGTAQVSGDFYNATMMAYGPTEDPEIAVAIIAEKAGNGYYLAESVAKIFEEYYRLKEIRKQPNWQEVLRQEEILEKEIKENQESQENQSQDTQNSQNNQPADSQQNP